MAERPDLIAAFGDLPVKRVVTETFDMGTKHGIAIELDGGRRCSVRYYGDDLTAAVEQLSVWARENV